MNDRPASARLFLASWPGPAACRALAEAAGRWAWPAGCRREPAERLHLTLHFLGNVPRERVGEFSQALAVPFEGFDLALGSGEVWPRGTAVLRPLHAPAPLAALHGALAAALLRLHWPVEDRAFKPHVTLARRAQGALPPADAPALRWRVRSYRLVESRGGQYRVLARFS